MFSCKATATSYFGTSLIFCTCAEETVLLWGGALQLTGYPSACFPKFLIMAFMRDLASCSMRAIGARSSVHKDKVAFYRTLPGFSSDEEDPQDGYEDVQRRAVGDSFPHFAISYPLKPVQATLVPILSLAYCWNCLLGLLFPGWCLNSICSLGLPRIPVGFHLKNISCSN